MFLQVSTFYTPVYVECMHIAGDSDRVSYHIGDSDRVSYHIGDSDGLIPYRRF